ESARGDRARGQEPRESRRVCGEEVRLRHARARRRVSVSAAERAVESAAGGQDESLWKRASAAAWNPAGADQAFEARELCVSDEVERRAGRGTRGDNQA